MTRAAFRRHARHAAATSCIALAACTTPRVAIETHESFGSAATYSRAYAALEAQTCEAARRTLLSQGYVIASASAEQVRGRKNFQPAGDLHVEVEFTVVCAKSGYQGRRTNAFVNAVQESYAVRKSTNSASLGLPAFGAVSLPFNGSEEALVKVGSLTIANASFYDGFFAMLEHYLEGDRGQLIAPGAVASAASAAAPASAASAARPAPTASN